MKNLITTLLAITAIALLLPISGQGSPTRTPPGSFVRQRVVSVAQLVEHVRKDAVVRQRYAKHFGIPAQAVPDYFKQTLSLVSLKKPMRANVWYINKSGKIHTKVKLLPKGTAVFVDKTGKPVIVWSCGNPLTKKLIKPEEEEEEVKAAPVEELTPAPLPEAVAQATPDTVIPDEVVEEIVKSTPIETLNPQPPIEIAIPPAMEEIPTIMIGGGGASSIGDAIALTGGLPIIGSIIGGGGGNKGGGGGGGGSVVPEASSLVGLAVGLGLLGVYRGFLYRRKK